MASLSTEQETLVTGVGELISRSVEPNSIVSALILLFGVVLDAALALEPQAGQADTPSALRCSGLMSILAFAAPEIRPGLLVDQRMLLGAVVAALALLGLNVGSSGSRMVDVVFTAIVGLASLYVYQTGGVEAAAFRPDYVKFSKSTHRRRQIAALSAGLMVYLGARSIRVAFYHASEVAGRVITVDVGAGVPALSSVAYGYCSGEHAAALCFGGTVAACAGLFAGVNPLVNLEGTSAVAFQVGFSAVLVAAAALWATVTHGQTIDGLPALYGPTSCSGSQEACAQAYAARRFAAANSCVPTLWLLALGMLTYAFAAEHRMKAPSDTKVDLRWRRQGFTVGLLCYAAGTATIVANMSLEGSNAQTELCALAVLLSILVSTFGNDVLGSMLYLAAMAYEEATVVRLYGFTAIYVHLTHLTLFFMLISMAFFLVVSLLRSGSARLFGRTNDSIFEYLIAASGTFGMSLAFGLYVATTVLVATTNGSLPGDSLRDNSGRRTMVAFALQHFLPVFAFLPFYSSRSEVLALDSYSRAAVWLLAVPAVLAVYAALLFSMGLSAPSAAAMEPKTALPACSLAFLLWASAALV